MIECASETSILIAATSIIKGLLVSVENTGNFNLIQTQLGNFSF